MYISSLQNLDQKIRSERPPIQVNGDYFRCHLKYILDMRHELIQLAECIVKEQFDEAFWDFYGEGVSCPGKPHSSDCEFAISEGFIWSIG